MSNGSGSGSGRGRPKLKPGNVRRELLTTMVTPAEAVKIRACARQLGYGSVSSYIRAILLQLGIIKPSRVIPSERKRK